MMQRHTEVEPTMECESGVGMSPRVCCIDRHRPCDALAHDDELASEFFWMTENWTPKTGHLPSEIFMGFQAAVVNAVCLKDNPPIFG